MDLAKYVAQKIGAVVPNKVHEYVNHSVPADADPKTYQPIAKKSKIEKSAALSMANTKKDSIATRQIALLVADGYDEASLHNAINAIKKGGAKPIVIADKLANIAGDKGNSLKPDKTFFNCSSVLMDAVYTIGGAKCIENLIAVPEAIHFLDEAYKHCKAIGFDKGSQELIEETHLSKRIKLKNGSLGVTSDGDIKEFLNNVQQHRFWERETLSKIPS